MCDQHVCKIIIFRNWSDSANQIFFNPSYIMYFRVWVWLLLVANTPISNYLNWIWNVQLKYAAQNATNTYVVIVIIHELIIHVSFYCCGGWLYVPLKHGAHSPTTIHCDHNRMELICSHRPRQYSWNTTRYSHILQAYTSRSAKIRECLYIAIFPRNAARDCSEKKNTMSPIAIM